MLAAIKRESLDESASIESGRETKTWPFFGSRKPMAENDGPEQLDGKLVAVSVGLRNSADSIGPDPQVDEDRLQSVFPRERVLQFRRKRLHSGIRRLRGFKRGSRRLPVNSDRSARCDSHHRGINYAIREGQKVPDTIAIGARR
jgi:hypothetical protein